MSNRIPLRHFKNLRRMSYIGAFDSVKSINYVPGEDFPISERNIERSHYNDYYTWFVYTVEELFPQAVPVDNIGFNLKTNLLLMRCTSLGKILNGDMVVSVSATFKGRPLSFNQDKRTVHQSLQERTGSTRFLKTMISSYLGNDFEVDTVSYEDEDGVSVHVKFSVGAQGDMSEVSNVKKIASRANSTAHDFIALVQEFLEKPDGVNLEINSIEPSNLALY